MGKRVRGAALRSKKRQQQDSRELVEEKAAEVETQQVVKKADEGQLFVLDNKADLSVKVIPAKAEKKRKKGLNHVDKKKVEDLIEKHSPEELKKMVADSKNQIAKAKKQRRTLGNCKPSFDLWGSSTNETATDVTATVDPGIGLSLAGTKPSRHVKIQHRPASKVHHSRKKQTLSVQIAAGGQSYHPDAEQHQDAVGEALAVELRRKEVQDYTNAPLSAGMSKKTLSLLLGSDDEEEESDGDDEEEDSGNNVVIKKRTEKLTRAQRNKKKRHRAVEKDIDERKRRKKFLNSVSEVKRHQREIRRKRVEEIERKVETDRLKEESTRVLGKDVLQNLSSIDPLEVPTVPVALSGELKSSLRSVKPKGSLLTDRLESFRDRNMTDKKQIGDKKKIIQGNKRSRIKVRNRCQHRVKTEDGGDFLLMG